MKKLIAGLMLFMPMVAAAQDDYGINNLSEGGVKLGTKEIGGTIAGIVNIILGFLGILATLIILLGGFKWMTSQGSSDKIDEAKKMIGAGVVGLVIIFTAYAISRFVLTSLEENTIE